MEILQTIWTALTTPNKELTNLITLPLYFIEAFVSMSLFTTIFNIACTKKQKITYVSLVSLFSIATRLLVPYPYNTYLNLVLVFLCILFIFKEGIIKSILSLIVPFIIAIVVESFIARLYYIFLHSDYTLGMTTPIKRLSIICFIYLANYSLYLLIKHFKINFSKLEINNTKSKVLLILTCIFGIVLIASQLYILTFYSTNLPLTITLLSTFGLLTYFLISVYTIFAIAKLEITSMNLEQANQHNKTLELLQDNISTFRHDFANIVQGMVGYIDKNDIEGLKKYHSQLMTDIQHTNNLITLNPKVVNNPAIYNVLAAKYHKADSLGIKINLEVFLDLNDLNMKVYEFTRILGILMDNAIEATSECDKKIINVSIRRNNNKHMQLLTIENTYKNKNIDTEKIYKKGYSTKSGNTGLGLWEIRQILKKNNNLNLFTTKNNKYFSQQFEIYYYK